MEGILKEIREAIIFLFIEGLYQYRRERYLATKWKARPHHRNNRYRRTSTITKMREPLPKVIEVKTKPIVKEIPVRFSSPTKRHPKPSIQDIEDSDWEGGLVETSGHVVKYRGELLKQEGIKTKVVLTSLGIQMIKPYRSHIVIKK